MTRLLFVALLTASTSAIGADRFPVQTIELQNFSYTPQAISLAAGKPVTLTFVNRAKGSHDFTAKSFFSHARILSGSAAKGEIELKSGQSQSITLVPAAGRYKTHCSHFMHKQFGMTGEILVQ